MNLITKNLAAASLCLFATLPVFAGHGHGNLVESMDQQQDRIEQGIGSAQLSRDEVHTLQREQHEIRHLAREMRKDGRLSKRERHILDNKLKSASHHIWELKHNEVRGYAPPKRYRYLDKRFDRDPAWRRYQHDDF